ncbi:MAG: ribonuclease R [Verrucomicrobia bacterium]|nr:ribonuclease R [Verrucomicrobiota bacterium]
MSKKKPAPKRAKKSAKPASAPKKARPKAKKTTTAAPKAQPAARQRIAPPPILIPPKTLPKRPETSKHAPAVETHRQKQSPVKESPKQRRLLDNLSKSLWQFMSGKRYHPMTQAELFERLHIPPQLIPACSQIVTNLIQTGEIEVHKNLLSLEKEKEAVVSGVLRMHPKGFGFVIPDNAVENPQDIFIPKHLTDNAVDGDHVEVVVNTQAVSEKGPEGKIVSVTKRARKHLGGTIRHVTANGDIMAYVPLLGVSKPVIVFAPEDTPLKIGDRVILDVKEWGTEKEPTKCDFSHILGNIEDPSCDVIAAVEEFDIRSAFPKPVIDQAKEYGRKVTAKDMKKRLDLSKEECFTIDPDTAKDFDDALTLTKDRKGNYRLGVHIADVAHYVTTGSPLDKEAIQRSNSTYFPGTCVPMLPEELSNELCSLRPDEIRLTVSVLMDFDKNGTLIKNEIVRSYIKSKKRFTYFEAKDVLDGAKKSPHAKTLKLMVELCHLLKKKRYERGSIDFALPELVVVINDKGEPEGLKKIEYDITHQLVEEFMLKANEVVAMELNRRGKRLIYRVHEEPQEENFEDFLQFARTLGFTVPLKAKSKDLQTLFEEAKKTPYFQQLSVGFIRSMRLAQYSPDNVGHFGLALEHYCHFTSPIRRYSDLIIQRLLFDEEPEDLNLDQIAQHCSDQERVSFRAEMSVKTLKKLRLLHKYFSEDPYREYNAVVTKIKPFGLFFELQDLMLEGFLHISELENDYFVYDEKRNILFGRSSGKTHKLGETIKVRLARVDLIQLESSWLLSAEGGARTRQPHFRSRRRR